jgi:c-di-GMP-binding flagellar brake protein YcgR
MAQRRKYSRVNVNIPISCTFIDRNYKSMLSVGQVFDLGLGGIKICVPVKPYSLKSMIVDYSLIFPKPFEKIQGHGRIKWDDWDSESKQMVMGVEFLSLDESQRHEIQDIVNEVGNSQPQTSIQ